MNFGFFMPEPSPDATAPHQQQQQQTQQPSLAEVAQASKRDGAAGQKPIGMACRACRQRKIRCGGERPRCSYCVKKGYDCVLTPHKKRGRPRKNEQRSSGSDKNTSKMQSQQPETDERGADLLDGLDLDVRQLWAELTGLQGLELPAELSALAAGVPWQADASLAAAMPDSAAAVPGAPPDAALFASNYAFPHVTPLAPADPAGAGAAAASGVASTPASDLLPSVALPAAQSASPRARSLSTEASSAAGLSAQASAPPVRRAIDANIRQYFVYVHPWLPILHRPTFERQVLDGSVDATLYYAVQAIAARFGDQRRAGRSSGSGSGSGRRPYRRGRRFARAAALRLPRELGTARLATLQALAILALYAASSGQWQEGAAYEKLAVQLAFIGQYHVLDEEFLLPPVANNLGLYEAGWSEHSHPARLEVLSRPGGVLAHEQRRRAWWAVFQLERFNGLAMGRPPIIKPGWHWVWLPCSEALWASENPAGALAWEMGLAGSSSSAATAAGRQDGARAPNSVSNCRVDLVLALIMGQIVEQRTDMFRLFFPRVDRGTLFYDNQPTHASLNWPQRLQRLRETVGALERRLRQWHRELDRYADAFSARRHANFELMGAACQIHVHACVLQIREHLFEDVLVAAQQGAGVRRTATVDDGDADMEETTDGDSASASASASSVDLTSLYESHVGLPFDRAACQRGYMARARRPRLTLAFVRQMDALARSCWDRSVAMADEVARLLRVHWLRALDEPGAGLDGDDADGLADLGLADLGLPNTATTANAAAGVNAGENEDDDENDSVAAASSSAAASAAAAPGTLDLDPLVADRFKLMSPQTPYHLFVAGKVQAARLKQAVTAQARLADGRMDVDAEAPAGCKDDASGVDTHDTHDADAEADADVVVDEAVRRINAIWDAHARDADAQAIAARLDDIIAALDYCQLFWYSLNFAEHLRHLKAEASKPLLHGVYRE
ncbi:hypothetical protein LPJ53_003330 [Coemansia erecta]|uniref:Zn(2)-C6 fungal-type domain-containing protein n=1 Tax=Coemansia erecta TaxID=147472 RepID=A0A9W8CS35_9FUNG|nr:hypothetical protein LPJ53_003330 [Coemansia erecta]